MGKVISKFPRGFDFGLSSESKPHPRHFGTIYQFSHEMEVVFGNKGDNLTYRDIVNGEVVGTATIQFDRH